MDTAAVLKRLEECSKADRDARPEDRMLAITRETGQLLGLLLRLLHAKNALEVGMSAGYSTLWCAQALAESGGNITTIEHNQKKIDRARKNFEDAGLDRHITVIKGTAADVLAGLGTDPRYEGLFDMAFIDADKENATEYFDAVLPLVRKDGLVITDNMLYPEKYRKMMDAYSRHIRTVPGVSTFTLPVGNGEEITRKL